VTALDLVGALSLAVNILTLLSLLLAAATVAGGMPGATRRLLVRRRVAALGSAWPNGRRHCRRAVRIRVAQLTDGVDATPAGEVRWLMLSLPQLGLDGTEPGDQESARLVMLNIASGFEQHAAGLRSRSRFGRAGAPVVEQDVNLATGASALLRAQAMSRTLPLGTAQESVHRQDPEMGLDLHWVRHASTLESTTSLLTGLDLHVTHVAERVIPDLPPDMMRSHVGDGVTLVRDGFPISPELRQRLSRELKEGRLFDGPLPRLIRQDFQVDEQSGRSRAHLTLGETSYAAVMADHYVREPSSEEPSPPVRDEVSGDRARVLTLSMVPCTQDLKLLFVRRSLAAGSH